MATYRGIDGQIEVGGTPDQIVELTQWEYTYTVNVIETRRMGQPGSQPKPGNFETTGTITVHRDYLADAGQTALVPGAEVAIELYPGGKGSGLVQLTGTALITEEGASGSLDDELGPGTFPFALVGGKFTQSTQA